MPSVPGAEHTMQAVDWTGIRAVYRKMNEEFYLITEPFGISVDEKLNVDLGNLIAAIDVVDRTLDTIDEKAEREAYAAATVEFLKSDAPLKSIAGFPLKRLTDELETRLNKLRDIIRRGDIQDKFADTIEATFFHTEAKRSATKVTEMIHHLVTEWSLAGQLPVIILGDKTTAKFERFFNLCCEMMPAVDMILDAQADYQEGQLSVRPSLAMYARLFLLFALPMPKLFWRFPKPLNLVRYTFTFLNHVYVEPAWRWLRG